MSHNFRMRAIVALAMSLASAFSIASAQAGVAPAAAWQGMKDDVTLFKSPGLAVQAATLPAA